LNKEADRTISHSSLELWWRTVSHLLMFILKFLHILRQKKVQ